MCSLIKLQIEILARQATEDNEGNPDDLENPLQSKKPKIHEGL